jgi:hypothetical protein
MSPARCLPNIISIQMLVMSAIRALVEIGVFEAIPVSKSMGIKELAEICQADESLIGDDLSIMSRSVRC